MIRKNRSRLWQPFRPHVKGPSLVMRIDMGVKPPRLPRARAAALIREALIAGADGVWLSRADLEWFPSFARAAYEEQRLRRIHALSPARRAKR